MPVTLFLDNRALLLLDKDMQKLGQEFSKRGGMREPLEDVSREVLSPSIRKNFISGGRPSKWEEVGTSHYREQRGFRDAAPLMVTLKLFRAATAFARWTIKENTLKYGNFPETSWHAVVHDSPKLAAKAGIPVRPFALIQEADIDEIGRIFAEWIEDRVNRRIRRVYT